MTIEKRTNISIVTFIALVILITFFVIHPIFREISKDSQWLVSEKSRFLTMSDRIKDLKSFDVLYENREEVLGQIDDLFIDPEVPVDFIDFLEKTADQSSVNIEISPFSVGKKGKDSWPFLNFQITISGSFPSFLLFLEKIENGPYLIEIKSLTVNQAKEAKRSEGNIEAILSLEVFSK